MSLRFITAGESHGPGLTAIVEGLPGWARAEPRGHRPRPRPAPARPRPRRAHEDREGPRRRARRRAPRAHAREPRGPADREPRLPNWEERMNPWPVEAEVDEVHLPRPGPRRPGRRPEVRPHRRPQRARARHRRARPRPGWRPGALAKALAARRSGVTVFSPRDPDRLGHGAGARRLRAGGLQGGGRVARALSRRDGERGDGGRDRHRRARPTSRSAGSSRCGPSGSCPGIGSHISWEERLDGRLARRDHVDPGDEGRGDRGRLRPRRPGGLAGPRRDLLVRGAAATSARPTAPAGIEGGMTTGDPVVVRAAMKPLPTLTKPLR